MNKLIDLLNILAFFCWILAGIGVAIYYLMDVSAFFYLFTGFGIKNRLAFEHILWIIICASVGVAVCSHVLVYFIEDK